jgi:putative SOS response-associated peptidase YedK
MGEGKCRNASEALSDICGHYTHKLTWQQIVNLYRLTLPEEPPEQLRSNFKVAPTHVMPLIRPTGNGREMFMAGWPTACEAS